MPKAQTPPAEKPVAIESNDETIETPRGSLILTPVAGDKERVDVVHQLTALPDDFAVYFDGEKAASLHRMVVTDLIAACGGKRKSG